MTLHKFKTQRPFYNPALFLEAYKTAAHFPQMIRPWLSHAHTQPHKYSQGTKMPCFFSTFLVLLKPLFVRRRAHTHTHTTQRILNWMYDDTIKKLGVSAEATKNRHDVDRIFNVEVSLGRRRAVGPGKSPGRETIPRLLSVLLHEINVQGGVGSE